MLIDYQNLTNELRSKVESLETLYEERTQLQERSNQLSAKAKAYSRQLYEHRDDLTATNQLESNLEELSIEQRTAQATLDGLQAHLEEQEAELHSLLPQALHTFHRLFQALRNHVYDQQLQAISNFINPNYLDQHRENCERLAEHSTAYVELSEIQLPNPGNWGLIRALEPNNRAATMQFVVASTKQLLDATEQIFAECERASVEPPQFQLGEPEPVPESDINQNQPLEVLNSLSEEQQFFIAEFCRESGRSFSTLNDAEKAVLVNSLELYRQSRLTGQQRMSVGSY
jgi:DNA repair exonuclease SbcCD ATPase subunit